MLSTINGNIAVHGGYDFWGDDSVLGLLLAPIGYRAQPSAATLTSWLVYGGLVTAVNAAIIIIQWKKSRMPMGAESVQLVSVGTD